MGKYTLLRSCNPCENLICAIPTKDIIFNGLLADMYNENGQKWGHEVAGDYCIGGSQIFYEDVEEYICNNLNFESGNPIFYLNDEGKVFDCENITKEEIIEIEKLIEQFNTENKKYFRGDYITFWNGSNWQTYLLCADYELPKDFEIISDFGGTIEDFENSEFVKEEGGYKYFRGKKHLYSVSMWQGNPFAFQVETEE